MCSGCFQYLKIFLQLNISNRSPPSLDQACLVPVVVFGQVSCCLHLLPQLLLSSIGLPPLGDFAYSQLHILQRCHRCQRWNHTMDRTDTWKPKKDISGTLHNMHMYMHEFDFCFNWHWFSSSTVLISYFPRVSNLDLCLKRSLFFFFWRRQTTKKLAQRHLIKASAFFAAVLPLQTLLSWLLRRISTAKIPENHNRFSKYHAHCCLGQDCIGYKLPLENIWLQFCCFLQTILQNSFLTIVRLARKKCIYAR